MDCLIIEKLSVNVLCSLHAYNQNIKKMVYFIYATEAEHTVCHNLSNGIYVWPPASKDSASPSLDWCCSLWCLPVTVNSH